MFRNLSSVEKILLSVLGPSIIIVLVIVLRSFASSEGGSDPRLLPLVLMMVGLIFLSVTGLAFYQYREQNRRRKRSSRRPISGYEIVD